MCCIIWSDYNLSLHLWGQGLIPFIRRYATSRISRRVKGGFFFLKHNYGVLWTTDGFLCFRSRWKHLELVFKTSTFIPSSVKTWPNGLTPAVYKPSWYSSRSLNFVYLFLLLSLCTGHQLATRALLGVSIRDLSVSQGRGVNIRMSPISKQHESPGKNRTMTESNGQRELYETIRRVQLRGMDWRINVQLEDTWFNLSA